jgi:hypothetical protein
MDEPTLASALQGRPMPEEYDIKEPEGIPFLKAMGAGAIDPFGLTGMAVDKLGGGDWFGRRMSELRADHPVAAGMGTGVTTGALLNPAMGLYAALRNAGLGTLGGNIPMSAYLTGIGMESPALSAMIGGSVGKTMEKLGAMPRSPRAQGAYPPDGAY